MFTVNTHIEETDAYTHTKIHAHTHAEIHAHTHIENTRIHTYQYTSNYRNCRAFLVLGLSPRMSTGRYTRLSAGCSSNSLWRC